MFIFFLLLEAESLKKEYLGFPDLKYTDSNAIDQGYLALDEKISKFIGGNTGINILFLFHYLISYSSVISFICRLLETSLGEILNFFNTT